MSTSLTGYLKARLNYERRTSGSPARSRGVIYVQYPVSVPFLSSLLRSIIPLCSLLVWAWFDRKSAGRWYIWHEHNLQTSINWWPSINSYRISSYFAAVASAGVIYDWVLTFAQEVELIWRQRWSLMTALYLSVRYLGISYAVVNVLLYIPTVSVTDAGCLILFFAEVWMSVIVNAILGVILIARLYAMYQRSRKVLMLLLVTLLAVYIFGGVVSIISMGDVLGEELIFSGTYQCTFDFEGDVLRLASMAWTLTTVWEVLALYLAVCIAVKHFRELRQHSAGGIIGDCLTVLMKTHMLYFASSVLVSCFYLGFCLSTISAETYSLENHIYNGFIGIFQLAQMFVLGPRLILGVREYHAKLVASSDARTGMTSIAFQERVHVSTSSSV